jgi:hypothetical protein
MSDYSARYEQARHDSWHPNECDRCLNQAIEQTGDGGWYCAHHLPPDPGDVRVYLDEARFLKPWLVALGDEYRTEYAFATEAEAVAWATEDGSGWTPADDYPTVRVVLTLRTNESADTVRSWSWFDMVNGDEDDEFRGGIEVTIESVDEVAR